MSNFESRIQASIVTWIRAAAPDVVAYAVPNDGLYSKREAAKRRWTGVLAGVPDLAVIYAGRPYFVEIKTPDGRLSEDQRELIPRLQAIGARVAVVTSLEQAQAAFSAWGIPTIAIEPERQTA